MSESCDHISCVHKVGIFENLDASEIKAITNILTHKYFEKGNIIYSPGEVNDKLYIVNNGRIKISRISEDGKEQIISILNTGEFTNELALFNKLETKEYATALVGTEICMISSDVLKAHMKSFPETAIKIIETLSSRLLGSMNLNEGLTIRTALWRLAKTILDNAKDSIYILDTTKGILASRLGMTQETLSRKLAELQDLQVIKFNNDNNIEITNINKLRALTK